MGLPHEKSRNHNELILDCVDPECPNPKKHLYINEETGLWICHRCGVAGNVVVLVSIVKKTTAREAQTLLEEEMPDFPTINELKDRLKDIEILYSDIVDHMGMKLYVPPPLDSKLVRANMYPSVLNRRKIPLSLAAKMGVRICNSGKYYGRLIFPFKCDGNISFVAYATSDEKQKTLNPPGGMNDRMIYNYDRMNKHEGASIVVVEGIFDCLRLQTYGYHTVALLGSFLSKNQAILLNQMKFENIIFMLDGDVEEKLYWKQLRNFCYIEGKKVLFAPIREKELDPDKLSKQEVREILENGTIHAVETNRLRKRISKIIQ